MAQHITGKGEFKFLGWNALELDANVDWETGKMTGYGKMKMKIKWLTYNFAESSHAEKNADGSMTFYADLESQFGNGTLPAHITAQPDGTFTGDANIKGLELLMKGKLDL